MKRLKILLIFSLFISLIMFSNTSAVFASSLDSTAVEAFFDKQFKDRMDELHIPNAVISVVADGQVILEKGYGYANLEDQLPVDPEKSLFRIGSTSKLFTWTAVMQLVEQGKLDLDADINTYLDFNIPAQLETEKGNSEPAPITLTHLMTHTAGFEDNSESIFRLQAVDVVPLDKYIRNHLPARVFPPGEIIAYSNYGTALAGYIVERVSGLSFPEYMDQHIFTPLQMSNSSFQQPLPVELSEHMTQAYRYVDGEYKKGDFEFIPESAGGMSTTAADMARFMLAYLQDGQVDEGRILAEKTVQQMRGQQFTHHPSLQGMAYGFMEGTFNGQKTLFHSGSTMLFDTGMYLLPEEKVGVFISYSGGNYLVHKEIFQDFLDEYYPASSGVEKNLLPPDGTKERSSQYLGEYHQNRKSFTTSEKFISLIMGMIQIHWDDEGYLLVNHLGDTYRFVEVDSGIYHNLNEVKSKDPFGDFSTLVFGEDPLENIVLMTHGPMTYSQAPWYSTSTFTILVLALSLLFILGSLIYRGIAGGIRIVKRRKLEQSKMATAARWTASVYSFLTLGFVLGIVLTSEMDPVYGFPKATFGVIPAWSLVLDMIPVLMALLGVGLLIFTVVAWWKKYWRIMGRIHYTLFTAATMILFWVFSYWNLI